MTLGQGGDTHQNEQNAIAKGKGSLAINAAAYSNVTVYQYVTYDGGRATTRETTDPSVCPYPGLETFHTSEAKYFAGREEDVALLEAKLKDHDICGVIAASGAGKSSLVHAGLIPVLAKRENEAWDVFAFKPGQEPLYGLARSMSGVLAQEDNLDAQLNEIRRNVENLRETSGRLSEYVEEIIRRRSGTTSGKRHHVLIFIDQWEELYTQENDEERDVLVRELMEVAERGLAKVLLTMRIDFMEEMLLLSTDFFRDLKPGIHFVEPMDEIGLRSAIEVPAEEVGLGVPEALTSRLIAGLGKGRDHGSLPYLQFVLRQLWEKRDQANNCLTAEAYDGMKGLQGAIGAHADAVFRKLPKGEQSLAQRVLPRLANVSAAGAITSRRLPFADFDEPARQLLRKLAEPERRLVVLSSATEDVIEAEIVAEVAHEALLDDWKTLSGWITDRKDFFRLRNKLEADAKTWIENERRNDFLVPAGKPLLDAQDLSAKALEGDISKDLNDFIEASDHRARSRKWLTRGLLTAVVSGIAGIAIYLANVNQDLAEQTQIAISAQTEANRNLAEAERQRDLAERTALELEGALTEAATNLDQARREAAIRTMQAVPEIVASGELDRALLTLLDASQNLSEPVPDIALIAFENALDRARTETRFAIPETYEPFSLKNQLYFHDTETGEFLSFSSNGGLERLGLIQGQVLGIFDQWRNGQFVVANEAGTLSFFRIQSNERLGDEFFSVDIGPSFGVSRLTVGPDGLVIVENISEETRSQDRREQSRKYSLVLINLENSRSHTVTDFDDLWHHRVNHSGQSVFSTDWTFAASDRLRFQEIGVQLQHYGTLSEDAQGTISEQNIHRWNCFFEELGTQELKNVLEATELEYNDPWNQACSLSYPYFIEISGMNTSGGGRAGMAMWDVRYPLVETIGDEFENPILETRELLLSFDTSVFAERDEWETYQYTLAVADHKEVHITSSAGYQQSFRMPAVVDNVTLLDPQIAAVVLQPATSPSVPVGYRQLVLLKLNQEKFGARALTVVEQDGEWVLEDHSDRELFGRFDSHDPNPYLCLALDEDRNQRFGNVRFPRVSSLVQDGETVRVEVEGEEGHWNVPPKFIENEECILLSHDERYYIHREGEILRVYLNNGTQIGEIDTGREYGSEAFTFEDPPRIVATGNSGTILLWSRGGDGKWQSETLLQVPGIAVEAEMLPGSNQLVYSMSVGESVIRTNLYSIESQAHWRSLGEVYKQTAFTVLENGNIHYYQGASASIHRIIGLEEARVFARKQLSEHCSFIGDDPRASPCWASTGLREE